MADARVAETMGGQRTRDECEAWIRRDLAHWRALDFGVWHAFERSTDVLVGRIGCRALPIEGAMEVELAWTVHPDHWGQGYALELATAARDLAFSRGLGSLVAMTLADNTRSLRVMDKLEMTYERDIVHAGLPHLLYRLRRA